MDKTAYRLAQINGYGTKYKNEEQAKQDKLLQEIADYESQIRNLQPRIAKLIETANACDENNIPITVWDKHKYQDNDFSADGISHKLGFCTYTKSPIEYIGCRGGGWAGDYDFKTDGSTFICQREKDGTVFCKRPVELHSKRNALKQTVEDLDEFESKFYAYVDSVINTTK